ncbi:MAG: DUF4038 domain-containing protein [Candidatus Binatia bacterium]
MGYRFLSSSNGDLSLVRCRSRMRVSPILAVLIVLLVTASVLAAPAYPVKKGPTGRYLVDQDGLPFLITGESPQAMIGNLNEAEAELFFANRKSHGFNTVWINLLCTTYTGCRPDGSTFDGILPFALESRFWRWFSMLPLTVKSTFFWGFNVLPEFLTSRALRRLPGPNPDFSAPNETYFARADRILRLAATYDFLVILDPAETGGWLKALHYNGIDKCRSYGQFVGQRYASFDNILWMHGNDFQSWSNPRDAAVVQAVARGIQDIDTRHLHTVLLNYQQSSSLDDLSWAPLIDLNARYTYVLSPAGITAGLKPPYEAMLADYNRSNFLPTFLAEAGYEFEKNSENYVPGVPRVLRLQSYWANLSGATGQMYGNKYTWQFMDGWKEQLDTPGAVHMAHLVALFESRAWHELVPDQEHTVVTAGVGNFGSNTYATVAHTPDGKLVIAYIPSARTIEVNMSKLSGPVTGKWYDPTVGTFVNIPDSPLANTGTRNFTTPGNNADGDEDWVLVLEVSAS